MAKYYETEKQHSTTRKQKEKEQNYRNFKQQVDEIE